MISMYAEYSGRTLYVCLSTDNNADDFKGAKNGDTMYHMDTGKRYVYMNLCFLKKATLCPPTP